MVLVCLVGNVAANTPGMLRGQQLVAQIGCAQCHADLPPQPAFRETTPDLSSAGLRYQTAWLFEFLQRPSRIRQHLGPARMPDFGLNPREALALALFLETQRHVPGHWPPLPAALERRDASSPATVSKVQFHAEMSRGLICLTCHDYEGQGGHRAVELTNASLRLRLEWITRYLVAPVMFGVSPATMPAQFFLPSDDRTHFREVTPDAAQKIQRITTHLSSLTAARRSALEEPLAEARRNFQDITATQGEILFRALNCAGCHRHHTIAPRADAAPTLAGEGLRVNKLWLASFLAKPTAIRPFGHQPGDGARMPDFHLTADEVGDVKDFLLSQRDGTAALQREYRAAPRSAFALNKASSLLRDKLSCLGCHALDGKGGRIAPDLGHSRQRLRPSYVLNMLLDPRAVAPHSMMPRAPVTEDAATLIADFLLLQNPPDGSTTYLSPLEHHTIRPPDHTANAAPPAARAWRNYARFCAACHGAGGQGDGFNATFLQVKPTRHADRTAMSARPDDTLFDGIHGGGLLLNKSHLMPAWAGTLSAEEIRELVRHLRSLCECEGPEWSRDNAK